jgi:hypothetical protein
MKNLCHVGDSTLLLPHAHHLFLLHTHTVRPRVGTSHRSEPWCFLNRCT